MWAHDNLIMDCHWSADQYLGSTCADIIAWGSVAKEIISKSCGSRRVPWTVGLEPDRLGARLTSCLSDRNCNEECCKEVPWDIIIPFGDWLMKPRHWGEWSMYSVFTLASLLFLSCVTYSSIIWENTIYTQFSGWKVTSKLWGRGERDILG